MEVLSEALAFDRPIRMRAAESTAVASLVPVLRPPEGVAFRFSGGRHLRINKLGNTDLNGGTGPWTEFSAATGDDGTVLLRSVKSGFWLNVVNGEFMSSEDPVPLRAELDVTTPRPGEPPEKRLRLTDGSASLPWPVLLRNVNKSGHVLMSTGSGNVACHEQGAFHTKGKEGKWARWMMEQTAVGMSFKSVGHGKYLKLNPKGIPELADEPAFFAAEPVVAVEEIEIMPPVDSSVLSPEDVAHFKEKGYVILRGAVPPELVRDALRSINHQLGKPDCWEADSNPLNAAQLALKLPKEGVGRDIFNKSPIFFSAMNILLGIGNVAPWSQGQQVALRFPQPLESGHDVPDVLPNQGTRYHIDGMANNKPCPFSLLCGVALSDQTKPNMGNLHVFPGSHLHEGLHRYYLEKINDDSQGEMDAEKPNLGESLQVLLAPGDVVIAHQLLAHRIGRNFSEHIRYQLYYRVSHKNHKAFRESIPKQPWIEFAI